MKRRDVKVSVAETRRTEARKIRVRAKWQAGTGLYRALQAAGSNLNFILRAIHNISFILQYTEELVSLITKVLTKKKRLGRVRSRNLFKAGCKQEAGSGPTKTCWLRGGASLGLSLLAGGRGVPAKARREAQRSGQASD